jgi:hypothetical protein
MISKISFALEVSNQYLTFMKELFLKFHNGRLIQDGVLFEKKLTFRSHPKLITFPKTIEA